MDKILENKIINLRNESIAREDHYWVDVCNSALDGDVLSKLACMRVIETRGHESMPSAKQD